LSSGKREVRAVRSRPRSGSVLAGLGAAAILTVASAPPVIAQPEPSPSTTGDTTATEQPPPDPSESPTPTDPPTSDPPDPSPTPTDPPTSDPPDPSESPTPTDPPTSDPPDPTPTPTPTPTTTPTKPPPSGGNGGTPPPAPANPALSVAVSTDNFMVKPGGTVAVTVTVGAKHATAHATVLRLSMSGASISPAAHGLGSVGGGGRTARATIMVPANAKPGYIYLRASASASKAATVSQSFRLIVTSPSGALPPGISLSNLPPGLPPLTAPPYDPMAGINLPQVALPPVASPQIAPSPAPLLSAAGLRSNTLGEGFGPEDLAALQAGWVAGLAVSVGLVLARARLARRRTPVPPHARRWLAGRKRTAARLRTVPPQPKYVPKPARLLWMPLYPKSAVRF
jgi:hypothetical protein